MCQAPPTLAAAEGRQVDQLDPALLPTDDPGPGREEEGWGGWVLED